MTEEHRATEARGWMLLLSLPGAVLCATVPLMRLVILETQPDRGLGEVLRMVIFAPTVVLTLVGIMTPFLCPIVFGIAIYRAICGDFRGAQLREMAACVLGSAAGSYMWLVLVGEALHGHPLPMFPWDPGYLSFS